MLKQSKFNLSILLSSLKIELTFPKVKYQYGIVLVDGESGSNPILVTVSVKPSETRSFYTEDKQEALKTLNELKRWYPNLTYKLISYKVLSD